MLLAEMFSGSQFSKEFAMQPAYTLAAAIVCALALAACKETPPPNDKTAMTTPEPAMTSPISSPALPGPAASDATPAPSETPAPAGSDTVSQPPTGGDTAKASSTAIDSPATNPMGTLTKEDEQNARPLAGQGNNPSSPSLEQPQKQ
jgi:hypothetical protein